MKKFVLIAFGLLLVATSSVFAQSPYTLEVEQEVVGTDLHMSLFATRNSGPDFSFGSCNFAVTIDTASLDIDAMSFITKGMWDNGTDPNSYIGMFLGKGPNFLNVSTRRKTNGSGVGQTLPLVKTLIAKVSIPIKDQCATNTSTWFSAPAAQNKFPRVSIKNDANFLDPAANFPLCMAPSAPLVNLTGNDTICQGTNTTLSTTYTGDVQWYKNGTLILGATNTTYSATESGTYTVEAINCACKTMSVNSQSIYVSPLPVQPVIVLNGSMLETSYPGQVQWYLDGVAILGANADTLQIQGDGMYTVEAINNCGTTSSDPYEVNTNAIEGLLTTSIEAYPNPFMNETQIKITLASKASINVRVYDAKGKDLGFLMEGTYAKGEYTVDFNSSDFVSTSEGIYMVKLIINNEEKLLKLIELK